MALGMMFKTVLAGDTQPCVQKAATGGPRKRRTSDRDSGDFISVNQRQLVFAFQFPDYQFWQLPIW
jgi:hypothetical protein